MAEVKTIHLDREKLNEAFARLLDEIEKINIGKQPDVSDEQKTRLLRKMGVSSDEYDMAWAQFTSEFVLCDEQFILNDEFVNAYQAYRNIMPKGMGYSGYRGVGHFIHFLRVHRRQ